MPGMVSTRQLTSFERYWDATLAWGHRGNLISGLYFNGAKVTVRHMRGNGNTNDEHVREAMG
jgi:hypothetical protein